MRYAILITALLVIALTGWKDLLAEDWKDLMPEDKDNEKADENAPPEQLQNCVDTFCSLEKQKVTRYACYVQCPEFFKMQETRSRVILEQVDYELVWQTGKPIKVTARDVPNYFGNWAREDADKAAWLMQLVLQGVNQLIQPVEGLVQLITTLKQSGAYEITSSKDGRYQKVEVAKKHEEAKQRPDNPRKGKDPEKKKPLPQGTEGIDKIIVWLNQDNQIAKFEFSNNNEVASGVVTPVKYGKLWNIGQIDITTKTIVHSKDKDRSKEQSEPQTEFKERAVIVYTYAYPSQVMMPSNIRITYYDKDGKPRARRNEPNPISISFNKYEVEVNK